MDVYDVKWNDTTATPAQRWSYNMNRYMGMADHKKFAVAHNKPMSFPEWGLYKAGDQYGGGSDDPFFIDSMYQWIHANNTVYQSYFNLSWGGGILSDFPKSQAVYKMLFGSKATDSVQPKTTITSPSASTAPRQFTITTTASDNTAVLKIKIYADAVLKKTQYLVGSSSYTWTASGSGSHHLVVKAVDAVGNMGRYDKYVSTP
jgi:hypothetical protein